MQLLLKHKVSLREHNTLHLESCAAHCLEVTTGLLLGQALDWAREQGIRVTVLGEGSNVICQPDVSGLVLLMKTRGIEVVSDDGRHVRLRVAAGENWHGLVTWSHEQGFHGLENLALIPGSVGAAPVQNIGAYGVEVADFVASVEVCKKSTGETLTLDRDACGFAYRDSIFKQPGGQDFIITAVEFLLDREAPPIADYPSLTDALADKPVTHGAVLDAVIAIRQSRLPDPAVLPNAGSFFKNPIVTEADAAIIAERWPDMPQYPTESGDVKLSAAWMIDYLGWRGRSEEGVQVYPEHALVLVNQSSPDASGVLFLAARISKSVRQEFGVALHIEPRLIGDSMSGSREHL